MHPLSSWIKLTEIITKKEQSRVNRTETRDMLMLSDEIKARDES
jgi:hypothetical protein